MKLMLIKVVSQCSYSLKAFIAFLGVVKLIYDLSNTKTNLPKRTVRSKKPSAAQILKKLYAVRFTKLVQ
jgi:hypothetical protein